MEARALRREGKPVAAAGTVGFGIVISMKMMGAGDPARAGQVVGGAVLTAAAHSSSSSAVRLITRASRDDRHGPAGVIDFGGRHAGGLLAQDGGALRESPAGAFCHSGLDITAGGLGDGGLDGVGLDGHGDHAARARAARATALTRTTVEMTGFSKRL